MYLSISCVSLFTYSDVFLKLKIVYTKTYVLLFCDLCFFFFRIKNINIFSNQKGLYLIAMSTPYFSSLLTLFRSFLLDAYFGCCSYFFLSGIGFRLLLEGTNVFFRLGYSNLILLKVPAGIFFLYVDKLHFGLYSINLNLLMRFCTYLRLLHLNNVYKQRGLYYRDEILNFKILRNKKIFF